MSHDAIIEFHARVTKMATGRSKEIRMTYEEALELANAIGELSAKLVKANEANSANDTIITGGSFT